MAQPSEQVTKPTVEGLLNFYSEILQSLGMTVSDEGLISLEMGGSEFPTNVSNKRLTLPTREVLRRADWENLVAFHPLSENVYRGESDVIKKLRTMVNFRLTAVTSTLIAELAEIAADKDFHEKLSPKQSEMLTCVTQADRKSVDAFEKVLNNTQNTGDRRICSIYLKRGGKYKGKNCSRLAVTSFPITEEFDNEDRSIFGVKMRAKDFKAFQKLFLYILPEADDLEAYTQPSNSMVAPYFHALMGAYVKVAKQLNKITRLFRKHLDNPDYLLIDVGWEDEMKDLTFYKDLIPTLNGNDGEPAPEEKEQQVSSSPAPSSGFMHDSGWQPMADKHVNGALPKTEALDGAPHSHPPQSAFDRISENATPAPPVAEAPTQQQPVKEERGSRGISWDEVVSKNAAAQQYSQFGPPPGFAGESFTPQSSMATGFNRGMNQQPAAPGTFGSHPRAWGQQQAPMQGGFGGQPGWGQPQPPQQGFGQPQPSPFNQQGPIYPGGI